MVRSLHRRTAPDLKGLYAEARILRDAILGRLAAVDCRVNEESLPEARAIVSANIGEFLGAPEYEILLGYPRGESRLVTLLVQSCAADIAAQITPAGQKPYKAKPSTVRRRTPLPLVAENRRLP